MKIITIIRILKRPLCAISLLLALDSHAIITHTLQDEATVATVNNQTIPTKSIELFYQYAIDKNPELSKSQLVKNIIENHLLTKYVKKTIGLEVISDETKVGFKQEVAAQDQLINVLKYRYQEEITKSIQQLKSGNLNSVITAPMSISSKALAKLFTMEKAMEYRINLSQQNIFKNTHLLNYQFPQQTLQTITLWDIYDRTNMQEKIALFKADTNTLKSLTRKHLSSLYVLHWVKQFTPISQFELTSLKQFITENRIARQYHLYTGSKTAVHHSNEKLRALSKKVSPQEINEYYQQHKESFKTVKKVKARHIQLTSQAQADKVYQELKSGLNFAKAIEKYSHAKDKNSSEPGSLGWIKRSDLNRDWLHTLPFTQKQTGQFSPPFMSPKKRYPTTLWEIIYLDERVTGYLPPSSKTVQYNASKAIAKIKINQSVSDTKKQLWYEARVNLNKNIINTEAFIQQTTHFNLFNTGHQHSEPNHEH